MFEVYTSECETRLQLHARMQAVVVAKQGDIRVYDFRHVDDRSCAGGQAAVFLRTLSDTVAVFNGHGNLLAQYTANNDTNH